MLHNGNQYNQHALGFGEYGDMIFASFRYMQYTPENCNSWDKILIGNGSWGQCVTISNLNSSDYADTWVTAYFEYDQSSGAVSLDIGGTKTTVAQGIVPLKYRKAFTSVTLTTGGWFTGHWMKIDHIKVIKLD
ncbi:MAG: hypothetical protein H7839_13220 [Magnetococcus sp. YQC-5]